MALSEVVELDGKTLGCREREDLLDPACAPEMTLLHRPDDYESLRRPSSSYWPPGL